MPQLEKICANPGQVAIAVENALNLQRAERECVELQGPLAELKMTSSTPVSQAKLGLK